MDTKFDTEKVEVVERTLERTTSEESLENDARIDMFTPEQQKKIIRRIDRRLVLTCGFMYCVSLMDRTNLGIAAIAGMTVDLKLTVGARYSIITLIFFISYVLLQPPATVVLRKVGPRVFLPSITVLWGCTMICFGFVREWTQMLPLRIVLGIFEAGFFPGCAYLLSCWYPRYELQKRNAVFYLIGSMSSAFSGVMAYGFMQLDGKGSLPYGYGLHHASTKANHFAPAYIESGIAGWRWIFILQGVLTVIAGCVGAFTITDFPEKAANGTKSFSLPFLNQDEANFVVARIEKDRHDAIASEFHIGEYLRCAADLKVWAFAALFGLTTTTTYAIAYFLPVILREGMGFSVGASQCLIAPPYLFAAIWMYGCAVVGDKYHLRGPLVILNAMLGVIGLPLLGFAEGNGLRYFGVFLATTSANSNIPCILTYQANNIRGQWKRALCSATLVGMGGVGGIVGSTVFRKQDAPEYKPGMYATILASGLIVIITCLLTLKFHMANKRADAGGKIIEGLVGFRYTL